MDPDDFGGAKYGEQLWLTGAASDGLSALMGPDDSCCGETKPNEGPGGCGKCVLVKNTNSAHPDWTAVVMKKNRCPPWSHGCGAGSVHMDIAVPGYDNLQYSTANTCGSSDTHISKTQSATCGTWYNSYDDTRGCSSRCANLPEPFAAACARFSEWGWKRGDPSLEYKVVECPAALRKLISSAFDRSGPVKDVDMSSFETATPKPTPKPAPVPPAPTPGKDEKKKKKKKNKKGKKGNRKNKKNKNKKKKKNRKN